MTARTWVIIGATSIIAEHFAHRAARKGHALRLVGRDEEQLQLLTYDIQLRFHVPCSYLVLSLNGAQTPLTDILKSEEGELDLLIAHTNFSLNDKLNKDTITQLVEVNILATTLLIHAYLNSPQKEHHLLYISSVAAAKGRAKNSLYGASKAAIEVFLEGLQQSASPNQHITIARLGFIDTRQTYGLPGIFYAASPEECAKACWKATNKRKRMFYFPAFWRGIMYLIVRMPFFISKKLQK